MRKLLMMIAVMAIAVMPAFAETAKEVTGTVDSIDPIDPPRGDVDGGIIVRNADNSITGVGIDTATVISDQATGKIDSGDIQDGDRVRVTYTDTDNGPTAITILRLEKTKDGVFESLKI
jgi:hypothetical protein